MDDFHPLLIYDGGEKTKPLEESREREKPRLDPSPILQMDNALRGEGNLHYRLHFYPVQIPNKQCS